MTLLKVQHTHTHTQSVSHFITLYVILFGDYHNPKVEQFF